LRQEVAKLALGFTLGTWFANERQPAKEAFEGLEPDDGKLSCPILRGLGDRKVARLLGSELILHPMRFLEHGTKP